MPNKQKTTKPWDSKRVRLLRKHKGKTQSAFAEELGVRQQTVSEWETGLYAPRGASATLLKKVAEESGFYNPKASGDSKGGLNPLWMLPRAVTF